MNKVFLRGHIGNDIALKYSQAGNAATTLSVATNSKYKDKESGESKQHTEWHRVVVFNKLAEIVEQFANKGSQVLIEGRLRTRRWVDKDDSDRWTTEVVALSIELLDKKKKDTEVDIGHPPSGMSDVDESHGIPEETN